MANEQHIDLAIRGVHGYLQPVAIGDGSGLEAFLRSYETQTGLDAGVLENPVAYVRASLPHDTRSPLVQVYDGAWVPAEAGQRNRVWHADVTVCIERTFDADVEGAEDIMRAYVAAFINAVTANPGMGGRGVSCSITDGDRTGSMIEQTSMIRHVRAIGLKAMVSR